MTAPAPPPPVPLTHVLMHVRDTLATDGRVGELGLDVEAEGDDVVVRGVIATAARQAAIVPVVTEVLAAHGWTCPVRDLTCTPGVASPSTEPEQV